MNNDNLAPGTMELPLSGKNGVGKVVIIDADDYEKVKNFRWFLNRGYAVSVQHYTKSDGVRTTRTIYMHRIIMSPPDDKQIDHKNHDKLDNRKKNLRICTPSENMRNKYRKGYYYSYRERRWKATFKKDGKWTTRSFDTEEEARDAAKLSKSGVIPEKKTGCRNKLLPKYISPNVCNGKFSSYYFRCTINGVSYKEYGFKSLSEAIVYKNNFLSNHNIIISRKEMYE